MPVTFSLKILFWQVILACICAAGLLGVRVRITNWGDQEANTLQVSALGHKYGCARSTSSSLNSVCNQEQQHREIRAHSTPKSLSQKQASKPSSSSPKGGNHVNKQQSEQLVASEPFPASSVPPEEIPGHHKHRAWVQAHEHGDLPRLPTDRSPDSDTWDNSVSICACMLQENTTDVREWLLYHKWLGVDHVYLTENSEPPPKQLVEQLQDFIDEGFLTLESDGQRANQLNIYKRCMERYRHKHNWMAFIDIDEFIVIRRKEMSLKQFLDGFKHEAAVVMHWVLMGSSGHDHRPEHGGVLRHYSHCHSDPSDRVKTIANTWFLANHAGQVHNYEYRDNLLAVDEFGRTMAPRYPPPECCSNGTVPVPSADIHCRPVPAFRKGKKEPRSVDNIALYHYVLRSMEDFKIKIERGGGDSFKRDENYFHRIDSTAKAEGGICGDPMKLADACCDEKKLTLT